MEDLNFDEIVQESDVAAQPVPIGLAKAEESKDYSPIFDVYFRFSVKHVMLLANASTERKREWMYQTLNAVFRAAVLPEIEGGDLYTCGEFISMASAGWNTGQAAANIAQLNIWLFYNAQIEFVPVRNNNETWFWCSKVNYGGIPTLPTSPVISAFAMSIVKKTTTLTARSYPDNFTNAIITSDKKCWRGETLVNQLVSRAPCCATPQQLAAYAGAKNMGALAAKLADFDPATANAIVAPDGKSIFANAIDKWHEVFRLIATDKFGTISCTRAIASEFSTGYGFFGELAGAAKWLPEPAVLKVRNRLYVFVEHTYIHYEDLRNWPASCVMYAVTPQDINTFCVVNRNAPAAVIMPLTALSDSSKHLKELQVYSSGVTLRLIFAATPLVAFIPDPQGLNIGSVVSNLRSLEKAIVEVCLKSYKETLTFVQQDQFYDAYYSYTITAQPTYGPGRCHVNFVGTNKLSALLYKNHSYMSKDDVEKRLFVATHHLSDLKIGDVQKTSHVGERTVTDRYPRAYPNVLVNYDKLFIAGKTYTFDDKGNTVVVKTDHRPDIYNYNPQPVNNPTGPKAARVFNDRDPAAMDEDIPAKAETPESTPTPPTPGTPSTPQPTPATPTYCPSPTYTPAAPEPAPVPKADPMTGVRATNPVKAAVGVKRPAPTTVGGASKTIKK